MGFDLKIIETGNGGDLVKSSKDMAIVRGFQNMPYLAMFGGNVGFITPIERPENEQAFDWWGNRLLLSEERELQFNSRTESVLMQVVINSSGLAKIQQAVEQDLDFMRSFGNLSVSVVQTGVDRLAIGIVISQPNNTENKGFIFIWDSTQGELTQSPDNGGGVLMDFFIETPEGEFVLTPELDMLDFI